MCCSAVRRSVALDAVSLEHAARPLNAAKPTAIKGGPSNPGGPNGPRRATLTWGRGIRREPRVRRTRCTQRVKQAPLHPVEAAISHQELQKMHLVCRTGRPSRPTRRRRDSPPFSRAPPHPMAEKRQSELPEAHPPSSVDRGAQRSIELMALGEVAKWSGSGLQIRYTSVRIRSSPLSRGIPGQRAPDTERSASPSQRRLG